MGNCLPMLRMRRSSTESGTSMQRSSSRSSSTDGQMSFTNPMMAPHIPHGSAYVNQLYAANVARQRAAADEDKEIQQGKQLRIRGLLEQIPADLFTPDMKLSECAICMIDFEPGESIRFLPCMHSFHQDCVDEWLLKSFTCPSCLEPVDSTILSSLTALTQQSLQDLACSPASSGFTGNVLHS